jgi:hypothetical protein
MDHSLGLRSSRRARTPQSLYQSPCWPASDHRHISESGDLTNGLFVKEASSASSTDGAAHNAVLQCRARRAGWSHWLHQPSASFGRCDRKQLCRITLRLAYLGMPRSESNRNTKTAARGSRSAQPSSFQFGISFHLSYFRVRRNPVYDKPVSRPRPAALPSCARKGWRRGV